MEVPVRRVGFPTAFAAYPRRRTHIFRSGNFDVRDAPRCGMPIVQNVDKTMEIIKSDHHHGSTVSIAQELKSAQKTIWNHLEKFGYPNKLDVLEPHKLTRKNFTDRIFNCDLLLNRNKTDSFLKRMALE